MEINLLLMGVSYFDGMASSARVRNLLKIGVETRTFNILNIIYSKDTSQVKGKGKIDEVEYIVIGYSILRFWSIFSFYFKGLYNIYKKIDRRKKNIFYNYSSIDIQNFVFIVFAKIIGYKVVFDIIEDSYTIDGFPNLFGKVRNISARKLERCLPYLGSHIYCISSHLVQRMAFLAGEKKVSYLPVTFSVSQKCNQCYSPNNKNLKVFYGGSFGNKDGIENLIHAFEYVAERYKNVQLLLSGVGMEADMKKMNYLVSNSPQKESIKYLGYLTNEEYNNILDDVDILCMTRVNSTFANCGFPFKLGEYLATGKAVIATSVGDVPMYLSHMVNALLIPPDSPKEISSALEFLINNPNKIKSIGDQGRATAICHFDSRVHYQRMLALFQQL